MPIRIIQTNERATEVQYICDHCGNPFKTSIVSRKVVDQQKNQPVTCWQCKQTKTKQ